ncbi:MAG: glycerol-3-phosphate dehydrogenase/oxidase [Pirellulales bacterium]|nr:glycerol-3-phosphate dehydrogenase/oxidase [Pirellulales bacterium]
MRGALTSPAVGGSQVEQLLDRRLDVLVIGGGIVGAGVARDAAMRGLRTGLVEQHDFASGTSSRSSRLLHGGMRYLAQGRVGLVWEASREKTVLRRIAPHLWESLEFIFPTRRDSGWPRWKLSFGVKLYDWLCGVGQGGGSGSLGVSETLRRVPGLDQRNLTGAVRYHDALTNDSRLVIDTILAGRHYGAIACNYVGLLDARREGDAWRCDVEDLRTGARHVVEARAVVNATGPWSDRIPHSKTSLRLTKGVHLVIERSRLPMDDAVVLAEGSRILFVIPWGERVILGTTDTDYRGELENPSCDDTDVAYIFDVVNDAFPGVKLSASDLVSTWSGLRPLVADARGNPSDISRRHNIDMSNPCWWDVTGGKLTTYRLMAEEAVDLVVKRLGIKAPASRTATTPLLENGQARSSSGILPPPVSAAAVSRYCREETPRHLDDVMVRRSSWRHYYRNHAELANNVAEWMAAELSWSHEEQALQLQRYRRLTGAAAVPAPHILTGHNGANGHTITEHAARHAAVQ